MEGSVRVFAGEFNASTLQANGDESGSMPWVVTPSGAWCRLVFIAGALTEVTETGDMIHCRLADPTGAFDLVTGGRNTALAETIRGLPVPSFITAMGTAKMYQKGEKISLSVRPEEVRVIDRATRDAWIITTSLHTLARLGQMRDAIRGLTNDTRVVFAFHHYHPTESGLDGMVQQVEEAVRSIRPPAGDAHPDDGTAPGQPDARDVVLGILHAVTGPRGISVDDVIAKAAGQGAGKEAVLSALEALIVEDECYQPQKGFVKLL